MILLRLITFALFCILSINCQNDPTFKYFANLGNQIGDLNKFEDLIFYESFNGAYENDWLLGQHLYDYRSGHYSSAQSRAMSGAPAFATDGSGGIHIFRDAALPVEHRGLSGIRLKSMLVPFEPTGTRSVYIRFKARLDENGASYNKVILTLNPADSLGTFVQESSAKTLCETEPTGSGIAFAIENVATNKIRLRVEKLTGSIPLLSTYFHKPGTPSTPSSNYTCVNDWQVASSSTYNQSVLYKFTKTGYGEDYPDCDPATTGGSCSITNDLWPKAPYANAGPYFMVTKRFFTLNQAESSTLDSAGLPSPMPNKLAKIASETMYQNTTSDISLTVSQIETYTQHEIEITPDHEIIWKAYGNTYRFSNFKKLLSGVNNEPGFNFGSGLGYLSIKLQQKATTNLITGIKDLVITMNQTSQ